MAGAQASCALNNGRSVLYIKKLFELAIQERTRENKLKRQEMESRNEKSPKLTRMLRASRTIGVLEASELRKLSRYVARLQRQRVEPFGLGGRH